jgi:threonine aldolase
MRLIDLRSDTVTLPTAEMRRAMYEAELGDDVFGEDPTVNRLEEMAAAVTGKEAAVLTTSGTQSNLVSVLSHTRKGSEIILGSEAHIFHHEAGGASALAGVQVHLVPNRERGVIDPKDVREAIRDDDIHHPPTSLVCLENTHNRCGGGVLTRDEIGAVATVAHRHGIPVHLDGARIFNAVVYLGMPASELLADVDSVGFCLSKGLSCAVGSVLCEGREFIGRARRWRKVVGGGMRQAGVIAAPGIVALQTMVRRLAEDHENARALAHGLAAIPGIHMEPDRVQTNLVYFGIDGDIPAFVAAMKADGLLALGPETPGRIRMVTHYGINRKDIGEALSIVSRLAKRMLKPGRTA